MRRSARALMRVPLSAALAAAAFTTMTFVGVPPASAHVRVDADDASRGEFAVLTFRVPGESDTGALTTALRVELPAGISARTEVMPGWTTQLVRDAAAGAVRAVTWTAVPGVGISADQFALFRVSLRLPDTESVSFPATQTYSDGTVVRWDQPSMPDGDEPDHPAPVLALTDEATQPSTPSTIDRTARWLAGVGLLVAAGGVVLAALARRRS